jgi:hypothetical protein
VALNAQSKCLYARNSAQEDDNICIQTLRICQTIINSLEEKRLERL